MFAALQPERSVVPQFVVQVVEVEAEGGRSLVKRHVQVRSQLRHVQGLRLPDCDGQTETKLHLHGHVELTLLLLRSFKVWKRQNKL